MPLFVAPGGWGAGPRRRVVGGARPLTRPPARSGGRLERAALRVEAARRQGAVALDAGQAGAAHQRGGEAHGFGEGDALAGVDGLAGVVDDGVLLAVVLDGLDRAVV